MCYVNPIVDATSDKISIRNQTMVKVFLAIAGAGTGLRFMPVVLHAAGVWSTRIPSVQSLLSWKRTCYEPVRLGVLDVRREKVMALAEARSCCCCSGSKTDVPSSQGAQELWSALPVESR